MNRPALHAAAVLSTLFIASPSAEAGKLPPWVSIADTHRAPVQSIPPIAAARLSVLRTEKYASVERLRRFEFEVRADGTVEERIVLARQFIDDEGVRQAGTLSFSARAATDHVFIDEAYVLSARGERRPFDPRTLQIVAESDEDLYEDVYDIAVPFAQLEAGSTAVVAVRILRDNRRWPLPWSEVIHTQTLVPVERLEIDVRWPTGKPAPAWRTDDRALTCRTGDRRLTCARQGIPGIPSDPEVSSWPDLMPRLVISEVDSWSALVEIERKLMDPGADDPEVYRAADRLIAGVPPAGRIEKLLRFVADEIRYVGFEHGRSAVTPHPPRVTLARRFGDCKDKVALFLALARRAGLDAYPVLVDTDSREPSKMILPSWKYFDHVIACVRPGPEAVAGAQPICLDPTDSNLPAGILSIGVRGAAALPLVPDGRPGHLPREEGKEGYGWRIEVETLNEVACDGTIKETMVRRYRGAAQAVLRGRLRAQNAADRMRWLEEAYEEVMGDKIKPKVSVEGLEAPGSPVELRSLTTFPATAPATDQKEWNDADPWLVSIGKGFRTDNRHHPYLLSGLELTSRTVYRLCPTISARFSGPELNFESEFGTLVRKYRLEDKGVAVQTTLTLPPQTIPADKLTRFNRFVDTVLAQTHIWYGLEPGGRLSP